jgi:hypothetical protein
VLGAMPGRAANSASSPALFAKSAVVRGGQLHGGHGRLTWISDQAPVWQLGAPFSVPASDSGSDALVPDEPESPCGAWRIWNAIWHGRRKTGGDGRDSAGRAGTAPHVI